MKATIKDVAREAGVSVSTVSYALNRKGPAIKETHKRVLAAVEKLGYVPEKDNLIFARLMDAGKLLVAKIKKIQKRGTFTQISIGIYLVDF